MIVHRLLAACIGCDSTHAALLDVHAAVKLCDNLNYRHRQAQYAGRASVTMNTHVCKINYKYFEADFLSNWMQVVQNGCKTNV